MERYLRITPEVQDHANRHASSRLMFFTNVCTTDANFLVRCMGRYLRITPEVQDSASRHASSRLMFFTNVRTTDANFLVRCMDRYLKIQPNGPPNGHLPSKRREFVQGHHSHNQNAAKYVWVAIFRMSHFPRPMHGKVLEDRSRGPRLCESSCLFAAYVIY